MFMFSCAFIMFGARQGKRMVRFMIYVSKLGGFLPGHHFGDLFLCFSVPFASARNATGFSVHDVCPGLPGGATAWTQNKRLC